VKTFTLLATASLVIVGTTGCSNFLTGGELSNNPNVATTATAQNLFVGTQSALWTELGSDMSRITMIWGQHLTGNNQQYVNIDQYGNTDQNTNGFHQALYITGGLVDLRKLRAAAITNGDSLFLGIAQVQEAWLMGTGADLFGDLVYSQALQGEPNPTLDTQETVYAHVLALLDTAIANMAATSGSNVGPGSADLAYGGDATKWTRLAHTLKARFYMHQIHAPWTTPTAMATAALAEVPLGLQQGDDYHAIFSGNANEQNFWYQFDGPAGRAGYYIPSLTLIDTLQARGDTDLLDSYFLFDGPDAVSLADARLQPNSPITFASYAENELLWAEAAYRTGDIATARTHLKNAATALGEANPARGDTQSGLTLLNNILVTKWIADFQLGTEAYTDYRRTCTPNFAPTVPNGTVPGRLFYDTGEQQTNTNMPAAGTDPNGYYNTGQPLLSTSDGTGTACRAY